MSYEAEVLADNPSAVWRCDTVAGPESDIVASNPMSLIGSPTTRAPGPFTREVSYAIILDGSTQYIDYGTPAAIDAIWQNGGTFEFWVRVEGTQGGVLAGKQRVTSTPIGWDLRPVDVGGGEFQFHFMHRFVNGGANRGEWRTDNQFARDLWYHLVLSYDYDNIANTPQLWIDKAPQALTQVATPAGSRLSDESYFGRSADDANGGARQAMAVSWVAWYKDVPVLSQARIDAHYDAAIETVPVEPDVRYLPLVIGAATDAFGGDHDLIEQAPPMTIPGAVAAVALSAGNLVYRDGAGQLRLADRTTGQRAYGFVLEAVAAGEATTLYLSPGIITGLSGLVVGATYYTGAAGAVTTIRAGDGELDQEVGFALSTTELAFNAQVSIQL